MGMQRDLDRLLGEFFGQPLMRLEGEASRTPTVDVAETGDEVLVTADLPGVDRDGLEVEVTSDGLSLKAEMSSEREERDASYSRKERVWSRFERWIPLPSEVLADKVEAKLRDGVLRVRLPKAQPAKVEEPTRVKVE
jgi:HSP20 family protein